MYSNAPNTEINRTVSGIPVRNLWLLMFYASELFKHAGSSNITLEENPDNIADLVAEILSYAVESRLHRNLTHGYLFKTANINRVRGRIDILSTERNQLLSKGKVCCKFEELSVDTLRNRYVLSALDKLSGIVSNKTLGNQCRSLANSLLRYGVSRICPTKNQINLEQFGRNDSQDILMINAAKLAFDLSLPTEDSGNISFLLPNRDEIWVRRLFEKAIGGFYSVKLPRNIWKVSTGKTFRWDISYETSGIQEMLPIMKTDIVLDNLQIGKRIVIDTKFNSILKTGWYREATFRSSYVYQMYSYLMSQNDSSDLFNKNSTGILLHPSVGITIDESVKIQGHLIKFSTVDLSLSNKEIHARLMEITNSI